MSDVPSSIVLTYFDIPGPAEAIRLAFYIADVAFEDRRVGRGDFANMKADLPFGQLPILVVDGEIFPQSAAILRFAGKIGGLYPKSLVRAAKCDAVIDCMFDIQAAIRPSIYETNPQRKLNMRKELSDVTLPLLLGHLDRWLERSNSTFFAGDEITICDLVIYTRMKWLRRGVLVGISMDILASVPRVRAHSEAVARHPKIHEYYTSGPGKKTGDGSPPLPPPAPPSSMSAASAVGGGSSSA